MGGDHAPATALDGVKFALESGFVEPAQLVLVGTESLVREGLAERDLDADAFEIVHAEDVLDGTESPVVAMKQKPGNSIATGIGLVKEGRAQAFLSAGSTGLVVASATLGLRCLEGIRRPGIAVTIRGHKGPFVVVDVGANPTPKAMHLHHYALMGAAYHHDTFGTERPRVGLMNIGSEAKKGTSVIQETSELLGGEQDGFEFIGNVEGTEIFEGDCHVVVCDGFTGNVLLKVSEGCAEYTLKVVAGCMQKSGMDPSAMRQIVGQAHAHIDYSDYGGALLLGIEGIVTICHGRSGGRAIGNAIRVARDAVGANVNEHIVAAARAASTAS